MFIYSPNSDGFYIFYISQGSVATQLRCGGMFSNHFATNFHRMQQWKFLKISQYLGKIWTKFRGLLFWATLYMREARLIYCGSASSVSTMRFNNAKDPTLCDLKTASYMVWLYTVFYGSQEVEVVVHTKERKGFDIQLLLKN